MDPKKFLKNGFEKISNYALNVVSVHPLMDRNLALQGSIACFQQKVIEKVRHLSDIEFSVFSQWGEDGIIEWLIHLNGDMPRSFIEFGVEDYYESNTRFLLINRNWRGLIIDGDEENIKIARKNNISWRHDLALTTAFITKDNINDLIKKSGIVGEIGILSIDIDGNDYWVWQAIDCVKPHIVIAEYNSAFGDIFPLSVPYAADFYRGNAHYSNLYYGASINALIKLAGERGYSLLGSNKAGSNAFFIRNDRLDNFNDRIMDRSARPSFFREGRSANGSLSYVRGIHRSSVIRDSLVADVSSGQVQPLSAYGQLYSQRWLDMLEN